MVQVLYKEKEMILLTKKQKPFFSSSISSKKISLYRRAPKKISFLEKKIFFFSILIHFIVIFCPFWLLYSFFFPDFSKSQKIFAEEKTLVSSSVSNTISKTFLEEKKVPKIILPKMKIPKNFSPILEPVIEKKKEICPVELPSTLPCVYPKNAKIALMKTSHPFQCVLAKRERKEEPKTKTSPQQSKASKEKPSSTPSKAIVSKKSSHEKASFSKKREGVIEPVQIVEKVRKYPRRCQRRRHEGRVILRVWINERGNCEQVDILSCEGCSKLKKQAIQNAKLSTYIPAKKDGKSIGTWKKLVYTFRLE